MRWWLLALLLTACGEQALPKSAPNEVPARWRLVRESRGHTVHLDGKATCRDCHPDDRFEAPNLDRCATCHKDRKELHEEKSHTSTTTPGCLECHAFGETAIEPWGCRRCHDGVAEARVHGKEDCRACHQPHAPSAPPKDCASCHEKTGHETTATHGKKEAAAQCLDCHRGHEKAAAAKNCGRCHDQGPPAAKLPVGHGACVDCHRPHASEDQGQVDCARCHSAPAPSSAKKVVLDHGKGPDRCITCHRPHGEGPTTTEVWRGRECRECHVDVASHKEGLRCVECHDAHRPALTTSARLCQRCHVDPVPEGHRNCARCHAVGGHQPKEVPDDCQQCHAKVAHLVSAGHSDCKKCHDNHGRVAKADCARCHRAEAGSMHALALENEGSCARCHATHDTTPKVSCTSCHPAAQLPGLHQGNKHTKCDSCHGAHQTTVPDARSSCLACHADRAAHEPTARRCAGCHPFKAGEL